MDKKEIRLQLYLSRCGIGSRRSCEKYIEDAKVEVNGELVLKPGMKVSDRDVVLFNGRVVKPTKNNYYLVLHKPSGFICSNKDANGRPLAKDLLPHKIKDLLHNVGRLDYMTSGLIFFTNDGEFSRLMAHPSSEMEKEYIVTTKKEIPKELMDKFVRGIYVQGELFKMKRYTMTSSRKVHIVLKEGKNRELRKVFLSKNITVKKIHRIRIGNITIKGLNPGHFRTLKEAEIESLKKMANKG